MRFPAYALVAALSIAPAVSQVTTRGDVPADRVRGLLADAGGSLAARAEMAGPFSRAKAAKSDAGKAAKGKAGKTDKSGKADKTSKGSKGGDGPHLAPVEGLIASWVQYVMSDSTTCPIGVSRDGLDPSCFFEAEVRAIIHDPGLTMTEDDCPSDELRVDGEVTPMSMRVGATELYDNIVCYAKLHPGKNDVKTIVLGNETLPAPRRDIRTMVFFGDSGCRMGPKHFGLYQQCNNPSIWPYERVANSVAESNPDVAIHTGDYVYREGPCLNDTSYDPPVPMAGCRDSPYYCTSECKDDVNDPRYKRGSFPVWMADFFAPMRRLFRAVPLVLIRGNHETCSRIGTGYYRYLQDGNATECADSPFGKGTEPWLLEFDSFQIGLMDSSTPPEYNPKWSENGKHDNATMYALKTQAFAKQVDDLAESITKPAFLLTHYPFYGWGADDSDASGEDGPIWESPGLADSIKATSSGEIPSQFGMILGSHIHILQLNTFKDGASPPQLVVANSGTQFVARTAPPRRIGNATRDIGGRTSNVSLTVDKSMAMWQFGFVFLTRQEGAGKWSMNFMDQEGRLLEPCWMNLVKRDVGCRDSAWYNGPFVDIALYPGGI